MSAKAVPSFRFPEGACIAQAQVDANQQVDLDSPATQVLTDLTRVRAATIQPDASLHVAEQTMIHQGVRMLFVVTRFPCVDGIVTAAALAGDGPLRAMHRRSVRREDLCVADIMDPLPSLDVVLLSDLERATVGDIVATLAKFGRPHLLVLEAASAAAGPRIRGLVSHTQIERQLGRSLPMAEIATSFLEIERALA